MSHYLDSGLARQDVRLDITDVYLFRGKVGTVFVMCVNSSAAGSNAPPGFSPDAHYDFRVDLDGDVPPSEAGAEPLAVTLRYPF